MITTVSGYSSREAKHIDAHRPITRIGEKKSNPVQITTEQASQLKLQPHTSQGRRDALLMCLLLDHGLRVGEVALLQVQDFEIDAGLVHFERPNLDHEQTHKLSTDTQEALQTWVWSINPRWYL